MWANQKVMRGLALIAVALFFGVQASRLQLGTFARAGAGMFPLMISGVVALIGVVMLVQARFEAPEPMGFDMKNIAIIMAALIGFVLIAKYLNVLVAIVFLVFVSGLAGIKYDAVRNVKISIALMIMAAIFHYLLGLNLPLL